MIVLDASVLIAHLDAQDACHERAKAMLLASANHPLGASSITIAEVLVRPARNGKLDVVRSAIQELQVEEIPIPEGAAARLAILRAETGLKLPDCCVVLAAQDVYASVVLTLDDQLAKRVGELGFGATA